MRTVGIIAEYNPFHTGHEYHIREARALAQADYVVAVMSPDFVQRGEPAVFDKYTRARMALSCGADLVLELPVCWASGSAEYFAGGSVTLLERLGVIDAVCFGAETADPSLFAAAAAALSDEPPEYRQPLRELLKQGLTYPQARSAALAQQLASADTNSPGASAHACGSETYGVPGISAGAFLAAPNNILGIEYCRALQRLGSRISPLPVARTGSDYNSAALSGPYCSATALRRQILSARGDASDTHSSVSETQGGMPEADSSISVTLGSTPEADSSISVTHGDIFEASCLRYVPEGCRDVFLSACRSAVCTEDLMPFLTQKLLETDSFAHILDISPDLSDRMRRLRFSCIGKTWEETVRLLKTKQMTEARIRRALLHLILGITDSSAENFRRDQTVYYGKVLGFHREAAPLMREIKRRSELPLLTKNAHAPGLLVTPAARRMWEQDLFASHLYRSILAQKYGLAFRSEYEISPVIL